MSTLKWIIMIIAAAFFIAFIVLSIQYLKAKNKKEDPRSSPSLLTLLGFILSLVVNIASRPGAPIILTMSQNFDETIVIIIESQENLPIYYTLDGSIPNKASSLYMGPFEVDSEMTVVAVSKDFFRYSNISREIYKLNKPFMVSMESREAIQNEDLPTNSSLLLESRETMQSNDQLTNNSEPVASFMQQESSQSVPIVSSMEDMYNLPEPEGYMLPNFLENKNIINIETDKKYMHIKSDDNNVVYKVNSEWWGDYSSNDHSEGFKLKKLYYPLQNGNPILDDWGSYRNHVLTVGFNYIYKFDNGQSRTGGWNSYQEYYLAFICEDGIENFEFCFVE